MITDEMLCMAAARSSEIYVDQLQLNYDAKHRHAFSLRFEKRIKKLKRRADHPVRHRVWQRVAAILLVILISLSTWLAVDTEARETVAGWIKEVYEVFFVYRFSGGPNPDISPKDYQLTWIPEGYSEFSTYEISGTIFIVYANETGEMLKFRYAHNPEQIDWFLDVPNTEKTNVMIKGCQADLFISNNSDTSNGVFWITFDDTAFFVSAFLPETDLVKIAESVQEIKN